MQRGWFYEKAGKKVGPVDDGAMRDLARAGEITDTTLLWSEGMAQWSTLAELRAARRAPAKAPPLPVRSPVRSAGPAAGPFRRFFARGMDTLACAILVFGLASLIDLAAGSEIVLMIRESNLVIVNIILVPLSCLMNAVSLSVCGNTVGKWAYGLKIVSPDARRAIASDAWFAREFQVWMRGMWFSVPILWLVPALIAYNDIEKRGVTAYDDGRFAVVSERNGSLIPIVLTVAVALLYMVVHKPPSRVYSDDLQGVYSSEY